MFFRRTDASPPHAARNPGLRAEVGRSEALARVSSEELVAVLVRAGAGVVSRDDHGVFLRVHRRLVFVRTTGAVDLGELLDAMTSAGVMPTTFQALLAEERVSRRPE